MVDELVKQLVNKDPLWIIVLAALFLGHLVLRSFLDSIAEDRKIQAEQNRRAEESRQKLMDLAIANQQSIIENHLEQQGRLVNASRTTNGGNHV